MWKTNLSEQLTNRQRVPEVQFAIQSQDGAVQEPPAPQAARARRTSTKIDQDKALAFYKDRFGDATDFTFVIVGVVDLAKLKPLVETYLASLPAKGRKEKEKDVGVRLVGGVVKKSWALGQEPKARVQVTFHGDETWTRDKDRDIGILNSGASGSGCARSCARTWAACTASARAASSSASPHAGARRSRSSSAAAPEAVDKLIKAALDEAAVIAQERHRPGLPRQGEGDVPARARDGA